MLHPRAVEDIEYAKQEGAKIGLITNGSRFTRDSLERIISVNVDAIEFSADAGDEKTYNQVRPGLKWSRLVENVTMAVEIRNSKKADTNIIVSIINQKGVDVYSAEEFWNAKVDNVQIRKFLTWGYNKDDSADSSPYLLPEERVPCPWLFERLNIDSMGFVTLCGEDIAFDKKFANITERSIKEIWHGKEFNYFREKHLSRKGDEIDICSTCPDWQYRSWKHNYWKVMNNAKKKRGQ